MLSMYYIQLQFSGRKVSKYPTDLYRFLHDSNSTFQTSHKFVCPSAQNSLFIPSIYLSIPNVKVDDT